MTTSGAVHRFLVAAGTQTYESQSSFSELPSVPDDIRRVVDLLTSSRYGGYHRELPELGLNPEAGQFRSQVRAWLSGKASDDIVVFYYSGHGFFHIGKHYLAATNTDCGDPDTAIPAYFFVDALAGSKVRHMLLILDVCSGGAAVDEDLSRLVQRLTRSRPPDNGVQIAILTATKQREIADDGIFSNALCEALSDATEDAGEKQEYLPLETILGKLKRILKSNSPQVYHPQGYKDSPRFFRNPKFKGSLPDGLDLETQSRISRGDLQAHWGPRSRGVEIDAQTGWHFSGRRRALAKLIGWLEGRQRDGGILCVTGRPGAGKSAVLARLVTLSDPTFRQYVPLEGVSADSIPPPGLIHAAVHCLGKTTSDVIGAISELLEIKAGNIFDLANEIKDRNIRPAIVLDALDEAKKPEDILLDLIQIAAEGARVIVGVRAETVSLSAEFEILDLDASEYIEINDIMNYVLNLLTEDTSPQNPYRSHIKSKRAADVIANRAFPNFLIARMIARDLIESGEERTADDMPKSSGVAFDEYLARFGPEEQLVRDLLEALSYAEGQGLPRGDIWISMARAISARCYRNRDVDRVLKLAASYIVEEVEQGSSVYRLYHRELAEHLQIGKNAPEVQRKIAAELRLLGIEFSESPGMGWFVAPGYLKRHLAAHAALGGNLEVLLDDPVFLLSADPDRLLLALASPLSGDARVVAEVYQKSVHLIRNQSPEDAASYLEYSAQLDGALALAAKVAQLALPRRWRTAWAAWERRSSHRVVGECLHGAISLVLTRNTREQAVVGCRPGCGWN
jgi:hypothetical protein